MTKRILSCLIGAMSPSEEFLPLELQGQKGQQRDLDGNKESEQSMTPEVSALIQRLQTQMNRAVEVFESREGSEPSAHGCAMGGNLNDLLAHNAEHERMHYGQISDRRYALGLLQRTPRQRYLAEWYRERATLIALLLDLPDEALDAVTEEGQTTLRQIVEHVLYWDRDSVEHTAQQSDEQ